MDAQRVRQIALQDLLSGLADEAVVSKEDRILEHVDIMDERDFIVAFSLHVVDCGDAASH